MMKMMKKRFLTVLLLAAGVGMAAAQNNREPLPASLFVLVNNGSSDMSSDLDFDGDGAVFSGHADGRCSTFTAEGDLGINSKRRFIIKVSGLNANCRFDAGKLLKLEINKNPVITETSGGKNPGDTTFITARNGEFAFDLTKLGNITQVTLVFYNCTLSNVKIELFTE